MRKGPDFQSRTELSPGRSDLTIFWDFWLVHD